MLYDDESKSSNTQQIYERFVDPASADAVDFLFGPFGTSFAKKAVAAASAAGRLIVLGNTAGDSAYTEGYWEAPLKGAPLLTFGVVTTGAEYTASSVDALAAAGAVTAAVVWRSDNDFTADIARGALAYLPRKLEVLASEGFAAPAADASVRAAMATACASGADTLWLVGQRGDALDLLVLLDAINLADDGAACTHAHTKHYYWGSETRI